MFIFFKDASVRERMRKEFFLLIKAAFLISYCPQYQIFSPERYKDNNLPVFFYTLKLPLLIITHNNFQATDFAEM